jgi:CMP-N-acetylneuraminic acid synthetase
VKSSFFLKEMWLVTEEDTELFEIQREWPVDIDEKSDLILAESLINQYKL